MFDVSAEFDGRGPAMPEAISVFERQLGFRLPDDYVAFLRRHNGGEGFIGSGPYMMLWAVEELEPLNRGYGVASYCPELLLIGSNGGGEAYAFDRRSTPWCVVQFPFVDMDYSMCDVVGSSFSDFVEGLLRKGM